jgi:hypothetical protein
MLIKWFDQFKIKVKPEELASNLVQDKISLRKNKLSLMISSLED